MRDPGVSCSPNVSLKGKMTLNWLSPMYRRPYWPSIQAMAAAVCAHLDWYFLQGLHTVANSKNEAGSAW
jgi:hypothetical protein